MGAILQHVLIIQCIYSYVSLHWCVYNLTVLVVILTVVF